MQTGGQVHEGGTEVLLPCGIVPEHDGHFFIRIGGTGQASQPQGLAHHRIGLLRDRAQLVVTVSGCSHHDVVHSRVFGLGQVKRHVHQRNARAVIPPGIGTALAVGHGLDHRDTQLLELGAPPLRVQHDLRGDQHIGQRFAFGRQHLCVGVVVHHRAVKGQRHGSSSFDAGDEIINHARLLGCNSLLVEGHGNHRLALGRPLPAQIGCCVRKHQGRGLGVVNRSGRKHLRRCNTLPRLLGQMGRYGRKKSCTVGTPAVYVISMQALGQIVWQVGPLGLARMQPQHRCFGLRQRRQRFIHLGCNGLLDVVPRCVKQHHVMPGPEAGIDHTQLFNELGLHPDAVRRSGFGQDLELAGCDGAGGHKQQGGGKAHGWQKPAAQHPRRP